MKLDEIPFDSDDTVSIKELKAQHERDEARAACAEMRNALQSTLSELKGLYLGLMVEPDEDGISPKDYDENIRLAKGWKLLAKTIEHALSTDCGKGYISVSELTPTIELLTLVRVIVGPRYLEGINTELTRLKALQDKAK